MKQEIQQSRKKIYLASTSERRRILLNQIGIEFELLDFIYVNESIKKKLFEKPYQKELPINYVKRIASKKAKKGWESLVNKNIQIRPVLAADTCIEFKNKIIGKPKNFKDAISILKSLSGQTHKVLTAVNIKYENLSFETISKSEVIFSDISDDELLDYCKLPEPYDKAGAYAIQGYAAKFIKNIRGSYSGIMGLPLYETNILLKKIFEKFK